MKKMLPAEGVCQEAGSGHNVSVLSPDGLGIRRGGRAILLADSLQSAPAATAKAP